VNLTLPNGRQLCQPPDTAQQSLTTWTTTLQPYLRSGHPTADHWLPLYRGDPANYLSPWVQPAPTKKSFASASFERG
jgi:hypothetical protein